MRKKCKVQNSKFKVNSGFSLIEMLVVLFVFAILAIVMTQTLALSLRGSRKSESSSNTRENVQYALNVIDRVLRNARSLTCPSSTPTNRIDYTDEYGNSAYFQCISGTDSYIASNSATQRLTSDKIKISNCATVFSCKDGKSINIPDSLDISITATDATNGTGAEGSSVSLSTKILLRNY